LIRLNRQKIHISTVFLFTLLFGILLPVVARLGLPKSYAFQIASFSNKSGNGIVDLPKADMGSRSGSALSGRFAVPRDLTTGYPDETIYAYIPKFEGTLEVSVNGRPVFSESSSVELGGSGFALFPIQLDKGGTFPNVDFKISEKSKKFVLMSSVFLGKAESFVNPVRAQNFTNFLRVAVLGMNITVFLMCVFFVYAGTEALLATASLVISSYFLVSSITALNSFLVMPETLISLVVLSSPILGANIWLFAESLIGIKSSKIFWKAQLSSISVAILLIVLGATIFKDFRPFQTTVAIIFVAISTAVVVVRSLISGFKNHNMNLMFFAMMLLLFMISVTHDILVRLNFFGNDQYLLPVARVFFVFGCIYILSSFALENSRKLKNANVTLGKALDDRTNELRIQFAQTEELLRQEAISSEKQRMRQERDEELHDGVLSYISVINVITAESLDPDLVQINKLSRFATNEIRLMMEATDQQTVSLLAAISLLRRQFIDRLSELGIDIRFDVIRLAKCGEIDYRVVVDSIRILQELVHNAAVRAGSRQIEISGDIVPIEDKTESHSLGFRLSVVNRGGTVFDSSTSTGSGIRNMRNRARRIGASFQLKPTEGGATAILTWPTTHLDN
jgi:signal transduction histidine kinase